MKAAVLKELGTAPVYEDVVEPQISSSDELIMSVNAVAIKNLDKLMAGGKHYASYKKLPVVVGMDGVGMMEDGTQIYAQGKATLAEKAIINKNKYVKLPGDIDLGLAAAIPNAALGSYLPLKVKGDIKKGDVVLINGGTGITGRFAIQLAKYYGASKIIVSGRIAGKEEELSELGADGFISTEQGSRTLKRQIQKLNEDSGIDLVLDYLWGKPAENIISGLGGDGGNYSEKIIKFINIGNIVSANVNLDCNIIRSSKLVILGSGLGSYSKTEFADFHQNVLPKMFGLAAEGKVKVDVHKVKLADVNSVWNKNTKDKRLLVMV